MVLLRDGADVRDGAPLRPFNLQLVLVAASFVLPRDVNKRFRKQVLESYQDKDDQ